MFKRLPGTVEGDTQLGEAEGCAFLPELVPAGFPCRCAIQAVTTECAETQNSHLHGQVITNV